MQKIYNIYTSILIEHEGGDESDRDMYECHYTSYVEGIYKYLQNSQKLNVSLDKNLSFKKMSLFSQ